MAESFLEKKGFVILERNFRFGKAEIDLIARDGSFLVVVEVKTRRGSARSDFFASVDRAKIRLLVRAIEFFMTKNSIDLELRFDFCCVFMGNKEPYIEHIPGFITP